LKFFNSNNWNRIRYNFYSYFYDLFVFVLNSTRRKIIRNLRLQKNDKILILGAGTGLDLKYLPKDIEITIVDISPAMINKAKKRNVKLSHNLKAYVMNAQETSFNENEFDYVILHLILAVVPNPYKTIKEAERLVKTGGIVMVYDKFLKKHAKPGYIRKFVNVFTSFFFSDINRSFEDILQKTSKLKIIYDIDAQCNGLFRVIKLIKA
jgi:phosphatidylethanolamine/phosphatidyl-N-methylethanolamine N-methyltransferase